MEEEYAVSDPTLLLISASDFAFHPGFQSDSSTKEFLDRFPLPVIINALQTKGDVPGLENALVACLERIFKTKYGASLIPQYMVCVVSLTNCCSFMPLVMYIALSGGLPILKYNIK
ncbi:hypothetical protein CsSME_00011757 [Camellia sinensis var. sinensis]